MIVYMMIQRVFIVPKYEGRSSFGLHISSMLTVLEVGIRTFILLTANKACNDSTHFCSLQHCKLWARIKNDCHDPIYLSSSSQLLYLNQGSLQEPSHAARPCRKG